MGLIGTLFSFRGRANRRALWATIVVLGAIATAIVYLQITLHPDAPYSISGDGEVTVQLHGLVAWLTGLYLFFFLWSMLALFVKRAHDHNYSGLFIIFLLIPIINIWAGLVLNLLRGTIGENRFGPDPLAGPAQSWKSVLVLIGLILVFVAQANLSGELPLLIREYLPQIDGVFTSGSVANPI